MFDLLKQMDGGMVLALCIILCLSVVFIVWILASTWASMHATAKLTALKREMLARGLPVAEIERLSLTESERLTRDEADRKLREAQMAADFRRDLLARGLPVEQVLQMVPGAAVKAGTDAGVLADTICAMHSATAGLDRDAVANLIEAFMRRSGGQAPIQLETYRALERKSSGEDTLPAG
jgi:hypothetical protein